MYYKSNGYCSKVITERKMKLVTSVLLAAFVLVSGATHHLPVFDGRIVGGEDANIEDLPYQLSLEFDGSHFCGATIISETWALSATHCVRGMEASHFTIRAGSSIRETGGSVHQIKQIVIHPNFVEQTADYDYALIEVQVPFDVTQPGIKAIALSLTEPAIDEIATISGWGKLSAGGVNPLRLQMTQVPIISREKCDAVYNTITDRMICAGFDAGGKDSCNMDSGGPLVVDGKLAGVVSFGKGCGDPGIPGVYANVAKQIDWIRGTANI